MNPPAIKKVKNLRIASLMLLIGISLPLISQAAFLTDFLPHLPQKPAILTQEDIPNLVSPATVRIINHVTGQATIPAFTIDWKNLVVEITIGPPTIKPVDQELAGSGFIVDPNGYILTNSHVISTVEIQQSIIEQLLATQILGQLSTTNLAETSSLSQDAQIQSFLQSAVTYLLKRSTLTLQSNITVLNPASSSQTDSLQDIIANGFPATILSVNNNFLNDGNDIGLIKINQQNLPSISLDSVEPLTEGQPIYAIGFPGTADINIAGFTQPSVTPGSINAIKPSDNNTFQVIQTDVNVSPGSSGSPILDSQGRVIGLITFGSSPDIAAQGGNSFAFGIPIALGETILTQNNIPYSATDTYYNHVFNGIALLQNNRCKQAIVEFQTANQMNPSFVPSNSLQSYISQCQAIIASGDSIDTRWSEVVSWIKTNGGGAWWFIGILVLITIGVFAFIIRRLLAIIRQEKHDINQLEINLEAKSSTVTETSNTAHQNPEPLALLDYVKSARSKGLKDEEIISQLGKTGYPADEIAKALELSK